MNNRLEQLLQMEQQKPHEVFLKFAIAQEYVGLNDDPQALKYFEIILQASPQYLPLYYQLGKLYERMNEIKLASDIYSRGIAVAKTTKDLKTAGELATALMLIEE